MRIRAKHLILLMPIAMLVTLAGFDSLLVHSAVAPVMPEVTSRIHTVSPQAVTAVPDPSPVVTPSPASPTPRVTVAATRGGNMLSIPSIGLNAPVVHVGVTSDNAIDVPAGSQVGYWTGSSRPGTSGATFLDGHVDGVFAHLSRVREGQELSVVYSGQVFRYRIVHTETVALDGIDMNRALSTYEGAGEGLNIMTCAGAYMPSRGTYDQRFVVYTVRVN